MTAGKDWRWYLVWLTTTLWMSVSLFAALCLFLLGVAWSIPRGVRYASEELVKDVRWAASKRRAALRRRTEPKP